MLELVLPGLVEDETRAVDRGRTRRGRRRRRLHQLAAPGGRAALVLVAAQRVRAAAGCRASCVAGRSGASSWSSPPRACRASRSHQGPLDRALRLAGRARAHRRRPDHGAPRCDRCGRCGAASSGMSPRRPWPRRSPIARTAGAPAGLPEPPRDTRRAVRAARRRHHRRRTRRPGDRRRPRRSGARGGRHQRRVAGRRATAPTRCCRASRCSTSPRSSSAASSSSSPCPAEQLAGTRGRPRRDRRVAARPARRPHRARPRHRGARSGPRRRGDPARDLAGDGVHRHQHRPRPPARILVRGDRARARAADRAGPRRRDGRRAGRRRRRRSRRLRGRARRPRASSRPRYRRRRRRRCATSASSTPAACSVRWCARRSRTRSPTRRVLETPGSIAG